MIGRVIALVALGTAPPPPDSGLIGNLAVEKKGSSYFVYTPVQGAPSRYSRWELTETGATGLKVMREVEIRAIQAHDGHSASQTGAWSTYNIVGSLDDRVLWSKQQGAYTEIEFTIQPGEALALINFKNTNGGIGHVTIDGQADLANLVPTDGEGNREIDFYSSSGPTPNLYRNTRQPIPIADQLLPGPHTLRLSVSGEKNPSSSDVRVFLDGIAVYRILPSEEDTMGGDFFVMNSIPVTAAGAWETVVLSGTTYYGTNQHGNERNLSLAVSLDGVKIEPGPYQCFTGSNIHFLTETLWHDENAAPIAENRRVYSFTEDGLDLQLRTTWITPLPLIAIYQAMYPVLDGYQMSGYAEFTGGALTLAPKAILNLHDNLGYLRGRYDARKARLFNKSHPRTFSLEMSELDSHLKNVRFGVWDLAAPSYNKLYFERQTYPYTPAVGEIWQGTAKYRYYYDTSRFFGW